MLETFWREFRKILEKLRLVLETKENNEKCLENLSNF